MALPVIKASDAADRSSDSIKIVFSIRALISVVNYNYVQSEGGGEGGAEEKEGRERCDTTVARVHERDAEKFETAERRSYS